MGERPSQWERMAFPEGIEPGVWYVGRYDNDQLKARFSITESGQLYMVTTHAKVPGGGGWWDPTSKPGDRYHYSYMEIEEAPKGEAVFVNRETNERLNFTGVKKL